MCQTQELLFVKTFEQGRQVKEVCNECSADSHRAQNTKGAHGWDCTGGDD